jgi:hypothetical protein
VTAAVRLAAVAIMAFAAAALGACGGGSDPARAGELSPIRLLHSPPVGRLSAQQLRDLSMECEKYPPRGPDRGRFDAAYCEEAIAAWSDSPLQLVVIPAQATVGAGGTR